jgi:hypothetical protein
MVFPQFKGVPGKKGGYWRPCSLATILLAKTTSFLHSYRRLHNKTLVPVNLGDKAKTYGLKNQTYPHPIPSVNKKLKLQSLGPTY